MKLAELEPQFLKIEDERTFKHVNDVESADGICFVCPKCIVTLGGRAGAHSVICWQPCVPQTIPPIPGRWSFIGTGYTDLTLRAGSSSVLLTQTKVTKPDGTVVLEGCGAHFYITNGEIVNA